jgi:BTB/POZ domain
MSPLNLKPAGHPFDDNQADLILRSNDDVDFRVFKIILSLSSQPLAEKVNNSDENQNGVRVVKFSQDSKVLDFVLRHLYPVSPPETVTLADVRLLAEFAEYFEVDALDSMIVRYLKDALEDDPIGVYAIAVTYDHLEVAAKAARLSLQLPISALQSSQLETSAVGPYRELIKYHAACGDAASAVASGREWFPSWDQGRLIWTLECRNTSDLLCKTCATQDPFSRTLVEKSGFTSRRFGPWCLWNYLHRSASVLLHDPTAAAVTKQDFVLQFCNCPGCPVGVREDMLAFSRIFATEIEKAVRQVGVSI